jgi:Na+-translocating ferredoxin:NAD+ oxidoreductase RnfG subunit
MRSPLYTILFMVLVTVLFIGSLSSLYVATSDRIELNQQKSVMKSVLYAFGLFPAGFDETEMSPAAVTADIPWDDRELVPVYKDTISTITVPVAEAAKSWIPRSSGVFSDSLKIDVIGTGVSRTYGFKLAGMGLWGSISAYAVVNWDLSRMVGLDIIDQVETPGLGARITEQEFKYFFRNLNLEPFFTNDNVESPVRMVAAKKKTNVEDSENTIQAITGATQTSNGIVRMMNNDFRIFLISLNEWQEQGET